MITPAFINIAGLVLNIIGAFMIFYFSPSNVGITYLYMSETSERRIKKANFKNTMIRVGMFVLFTGFILQLIAIL